MAAFGRGDRARDGSSQRRRARENPRAQRGQDVQVRCRIAATAAPQRIGIRSTLNDRFVGGHMIEIGIFHNGASDLPVVRTSSGVAINDGNLAEVHESSQRGLVGQVRQGILADKLGFNYFFMTEHHFQPEGAEFSPNPLLAETAIAARTRRIRLGQAANIAPWWHPIRIAEQAAMLDVISGGRLEFGIGRGYQPREAEVFGWPFATIQDQERNRAYYQEAYEIIIKAWTQSSFSHHGQFFTIPPVFTRWNHKQTIAYFKNPRPAAGSKTSCSWAHLTPMEGR